MNKNKIKVIAELCQNHKGDFKIVEEMVHAASEAGADAAQGPARPGAVRAGVRARQ